MKKGRKKKTQQQRVIGVLEVILDNPSVKYKGDVYSRVMELTGAPRPTVRRCARLLRMMYIERIEKLQAEKPIEPKEPWLV